MQRERDTEELDLNFDEPLIERWRHLKVGGYRPSSTNSVGEKSWWMVVYTKATIHIAPDDQAEAVGELPRGEPVYCLAMTDSWIRIDPHRDPPPAPRVTAPAKEPKPRSPLVPSDFAREAWVLWNGQELGLGSLLMPVAHLDKLLQYRSTNVSLPREAVMWTLSEVDIFLGSLGFVKPGRESAMMRCSKRLVRAVRGGAMGLEYRVDEKGRSGGVFAADTVEKGRWVEVCPLLEVDRKCYQRSATLRGITVPTARDKSQFAIVLGFGKVFTTSKTPNLNWSYRGDDEVVVWASEEVHSGRELTVNFSQPPRPLGEAKKGPTTWHAPFFKGSGKLQSAGYVVHGNSGIHGRGVFATKDLQPGELLESCPAIVLDEAAAEAMFSYRWGLADDPNGDFYTPLGMGSLYNHSERPNARGSLDVKRRVLEFYVTRELHKGQEVLVSYGDTYFDEDYAGHRKSELLDIEAPETDGDLELKKLVELQRALIRAFTSEDFTREMKNRAGQRQKLVGEVKGQMVSKELFGKTKSIHSLVMETEQPILERFGYEHGMQGAWKMQEDLVRKTANLNHDHEAVRNNAILTAVLHRYDPPPVEYWETMDLELIILGTEETEAPEVFRAAVPKKVPCGFARFMLSLRFAHHPKLSGYSEELVRLVGGGGGKPYFAYKDSEPLPAGRRIFVSGAGNAWPALPKREGEEELTDWEIIWRWLSNGEAQRRANDFQSHRYKIAGTWDDFKCNDMQWTGQNFIHFVTLSEQKWESFQILYEGRWETTLYPDTRDGSPWVKHKLMGPDNKGHGKNWTMGRHPDDAGEPGTVYKVELLPDEVGRPASVHWTRIQQDQVANTRRNAEQQVQQAEEQRRIEEVQETRRRAADSTAFKTESLLRRQPNPEWQDPEEAAARGAAQFDFGLLDEAEATSKCT